MYLRNMPEPMLVGITRAQFRRVSTVGGVLGVLLLGLFIYVGYAHGTVRTVGDVFRATVWAFAIASILPFAVGMSGLLRLRFDDGEISQMFGPWVIAKRPTRSLRQVTFGGRLFQLVLRFEDGTRFRLLALHLRDFSSVSVLLQKVAPHAVIE
jgi:hypothetical protein